MNKVYLVYSKFVHDWELKFVSITKQKAEHYISDAHFNYRVSDSWFHEAEYKIVEKEVE